jgi:hypothetical protein
VSSLAFLVAPLHCPVCRNEITDQAWFIWGFCQGTAPRPETTYHVGDAIRWRTCPDGTTPAWTRFIARVGDGGGNLGDPAVRSLLVRDVTQSWLSGPCPACGAALDGAVVEVRDGLVAEARLLRPGELPAGEYLLPAPGGGWEEAPWGGEMPVDVRTDC